MKQRMQNRRKGISRVNYVSDEPDEWDDDPTVMQVNEAGAKPFMIEGLKCSRPSLILVPLSLFS